MTTIDAWQWIFANWMCPAWKGIPETYRNAIGLDARLGMCHGQLVTQQGAKGMTEFIKRLNNKVLAS